MVGRVLLLFLIAVASTAFFMREAQSHELPCFSVEQGALFQPKGLLRGYGTTEEGLVKLSVTSAGNWMLTFSPPSLNGGLCIVWMGENWEWVVPKNPGRKAQRDDS